MRPYPRNSPRAAARIVALTLLADGKLQPVDCRTVPHGTPYHTQ